MTIRVLLADDHELIRTGLRAAIAMVEDITLIGEAVNGEETLQMARDMKPDVLLLDISMPGPPAIETVGKLRTQAPVTKILVLTAYDSPGLAQQLIASGVSGYLLKEETNATVMAAIRAVALGGAWFSQSLVPGTLQFDPVTGLPLVSPALTEQELVTLRLIASGKTDLEISDVLYISDRTARRYLRTICDKLGVESRLEAVARAVQMKLIDL